MSEPTRLEFMYRPPGSKEYQNITHVLDDILIKLQALEMRLKELEERTSWQ